MLRQNRSEGSSTSRSFAKTALLRARRKTFQFSDEQFARHIFLTEPLFLIPSVQNDVNESGSTRGAILFSKEPLFLMPPGRARSPRGSQGSRVRKAGPPHYFRGNHFSSFLPAEIGCPAPPADRLAENHCTCLRGNHFSSFLPAETGAAGSKDIRLTGERRVFFAGTTFPHSVLFTDARWPQTLSSSSFSSSSLQGGSGIPAVPKTGASVLRLLPPTS